VDTAQLREWATDHGDSAVIDTQDQKLSLTSKLLRFRWQGAHAVGVGSDAASSVRINVVVDALAWYQATHTSTDDTIHLVLGLLPGDEGEAAAKEELGAIGTLVGQLAGGPDVIVWRADGASEPYRMVLEPAVFTAGKSQEWNTLLEVAADRQVIGVAEEVVTQVGHPAFALYPKLSSKGAKAHWQMRLDGVDIGRIGADGALLRLASRNLDAQGEPRDTCRRVVVEKERAFRSSETGELTAPPPGPRPPPEPGTRPVPTAPQPDQYRRSRRGLHIVAAIRQPQRSRDPCPAWWTPDLHPLPTRTRRARFHRLLESADHARSTARTGGNEWFLTSVRFLDEIANTLGLERQDVGELGDLA